MAVPNFCSTFLGKKLSKKRKTTFLKLPDIGHRLAAGEHVLANIL